jgi:PRTRC genetic system protein C
VKVQSVRRLIKFNDIELADLNPGVPMEEVLKMHASTNVHPELSTAIFTGPVMKGSTAVYTAELRLGTKG